MLCPEFHQSKINRKIDKEGATNAEKREGSNTEGTTDNIGSVDSLNRGAGQDTLSAISRAERIPEEA